MSDDLVKGVFSMNLAKHVPAAAGDISAQLSVVLIRLCCVFRVTGHSSWRRRQLGTQWRAGRGPEIDEGHVSRPRVLGAASHGAGSLVTAA